MKVRSVFAAVVVVATSLLASPVVQAASVHTPVNAVFGFGKSTKNVKLVLMNDTGTPMEVKAGEEIIKLDVGKPVTVNLPEGTQVICNSATPHNEPGKLIAQISNSLSGATIHIR